MPSEPYAWILVGTLVTLIVTALWRGWVIPRPTIRTERALQDEINDLRKQTSDAIAARADVTQADLMKVSTQLTQLIPELIEALRRSRPAA